jgi:hypothetical protein
LIQPDGRTKRSRGWNAVGLNGPAASDRPDGVGATDGAADGAADGADGVGDGWCFACGGFAGHVKLAFGRGTSLTPVPPATPIGMGKTTRGVDIETVDDIDERQVASWMRQATALPGFGKTR